MPKYLLMRHPGYNRVYHDASLSLAFAELKAALPGLEAKTSEIGQEEVGGISYLGLRCESPLSPLDLERIGGLSFLYAIFQLEENHRATALLPLTNPYRFHMEEKFSSVLRYSGKTNELFTRFMIHTAGLLSDFDAQSNLHLLDPVCGRGTTLYEAAMRGYDAFGVDIEKKSVHEAFSYVKTYLKKERWKFSASHAQVAGSSKAEGIFMDWVDFARDKEQLAGEGEGVRSIGLICGDALSIHQYFKKDSFDLIVGDLPYGVQHGSRMGRSKGKSRTAPTRNPSELVKEALPGWQSVLRSGGVIALSWNTLVSSRSEMIGAAVGTGVEPAEGDPWERLSHRVDQSIRRDVLFLKKPI